MKKVHPVGGENLINVCATCSTYDLRTWGDAQAELQLLTSPTWLVMRLLWIVFVGCATAG